jgi:enediyne biosynthesis protein E4
MFPLKGADANTNGIGVKTYLFHNGKLQYQQLMLTRGFQSSSEPRLHFGLDSIKTIDSILIVWPNQKYQVLKNVKANQFLTIHQNDAAGVFVHNDYFKPTAELLEKQDINTNWSHQENDFLDYNVQYLIPHSQSTRGPKIAVADINGDGLDDFFVCGARGQAGAIMIQQKNGSFTSVNTALFAADAGSEDVDAVFFDANGDGHPDLYVVSGGNELTGKDSALLDRLYLNDGNGVFTKSTTSLPFIFENKSCVAVADVDRDGDLDIFVGNLANSRAYGIPQTSFLLINNGKGVFSVSAQNVIDLNNVGLVTSAAFADLDNNGWPDLVVAGEWMPLTIFNNNKGAFTKSAIANSTGWWQTIFIDDVNNDGSPDILAGNWGWNNKFWSGKNGPVRLYVSDFDRNGRVDQLMSYTLDGKEYPFLAKDEVERALPVLKKHYLLYAEYAGEVMKDVFYGFVDTIKPLVAERLGSAIFFNNGKGVFDIQDLPPGLQMAPVFSIQKMGNNAAGDNMYLLGGNFYDVIPYEGRYDAQPLAAFSINRTNKISFLPQQNLSDLKYQVRDIKRLGSANGDLFAIAPNNAPLLFFRKKKE